MNQFRIFRRVIAIILIFTLTIGMIPVTALEYGNILERKGNEINIGSYRNFAENYRNLVGLFNRDYALNDKYPGEKSSVDEGYVEDDVIGESQGDYGTYGYISIPLKMSSPPYDWSSDATDDNLEGVTGVTLNPGATGTLNLTEETVTINVITPGAINGTIVAGNGVKKIIFTGVSGGSVDKLEYEGTEALTIIGATAFESGKGFYLSAVKMQNSQASLNLETDGGTNLSIGSISGNFHTLEAEGWVNIGSSGFEDNKLRISGSIDTIKIGSGNVYVYSPGEDSDKPTNTAVPSVKNIEINEGKLTVSVGNNNSSNVNSGDGIVLEDGGTINITNGGSLNASGSDGSYEGNNGGTGLKTKGSAVISLDNGSMIITGLGGGSGANGGAAWDAGGKAEIFLINNSSVSFNGANYVENATALKGSGEVEVFLKYGTKAEFTGGQKSSAVQGPLTVDFQAAGADSSEYAYDAPTLILKNGSGYEGNDGEEVTINRHVPGEFKYTAEDFDIAGSDADDSFKIKPESEYEYGVNNGQIYLAHHSEKPFYIYSGETADEPNSYMGFTVNGEDITTNSMGYAQLPILNDDGTHTVSGGLLESFGITVSDGKIQTANLPAGVTVVDNGYCLQILTALPDYIDFTSAEQVGGTSGKVNSQGILLSTDKDISGSSGVSVKKGETIIQTVKPTKQDGKWYVPLNDLTDIQNGDKVTVSIANWDSYVVRPSSMEVTLYKRAAERTYTLDRVGGADGLTDSTGILVTFDQDTQLTQGQINLTGASIASLTDNGDDDGKTWLINIKDITVENNHFIEVVIGDGADYTVDNTKHIVHIYRSSELSLNFTADQIGGENGVKTSSGILLAFDKAVDRLTKEKITLTGADGASITELTATNTNDEGKSDKWLLTIAGNFANNAIATVAVGNWSGTDAHYKVDSPQNVALYSDARAAVTFIAKQTDGISNTARTRTVQLTFDKDVDHLTTNRIKLTGAAAKSLKQDEYDKKIWYLTIEGISVKDGQNIGVEIESWQNYRIETEKVDVQVFTANKVSFSAAQIGGSDKTAHTTGILLTFSEGLITTPTAIEVSVAIDKKTYTDYEITDNDDDNAATWLLKLPNKPDWDNNSTAAVTVGNNEDGDIMVGGREIPNENIYRERSTRIYKDLQTHINLKAEQLRGEKGVKNTEYILLTLLDKEGGEYIPVNHSFTKKDITVEGATVTGVSSFKGNIYLYVGGYNNDDELTITVNNPSRAVIDNNTVKVNVYKDVRVTNEAKASANGRRGFEETTEILFTFTKPVDNLEKDHITFSKDIFDMGELTKIGDGTQWSLGVSNVKEDKSIDITLSIPGYYFYMRTLYSVGIAKDTRKYIDVSVSQYGGKDGSKNSEGIKITYISDREIIDNKDVQLLSIQPLNKDKGRAGTISWSRYSVEKEVKNIDGKVHTSYYYEFFSGPGTDILVNKDILVARIEARTWESHIALNDTGANFQAEYYKGVEMGGRTLESVSPRVLYNKDEKQSLTFIGYFGYSGKEITALNFKDNKGNVELVTQFDVINQTSYSSDKRDKIKIDVSNVNMLKNVGKYEVSFGTVRGNSEYVPLEVSDDRIYSNNTYGILTITQRQDNSLVMEFFGTEKELKEDKSAGTTLLSFKGRVIPDSQGNGYRVSSDSTMNKALEYIAGSGASIRITEETGGRIKISAAEGSLKWNGLTLANGFDIVLDPANKYRNRRLTEGKDVLLSTMYTESFDIFFMRGELEQYRIYEEEFSLAGQLVLGGAIPFIADNIGAGAILHEMILREGLRELPPTHAEAYVDFSPSDWFGDFVGANGKFYFEIDSLPETEPSFVSLSGDLTINDVIFVEGEFVFMWGEANGRNLFIPDTLKFFARTDAEGTGIPLLPPVTVAYITGAGGSIEGLGKSAYKQFNYIPPFKLTLSGAIKDVTGSIVDVQKATITMGPSEFSAIANEMKVLEFLTIEDVGIAMGLRDSKDMNTPPDAYFYYKGSIGLKSDALVLRASVDLGLELLGEYLSGAMIEYMEQVYDSGNKLQLPNDSVKSQLDKMIVFWGYADASATLPWLFDATGYGKLYADRQRISGKLGADLGAWEPSVSVAYNFNTGKFSWNRRSAVMAQEGMVLGEGENGEKFIATNMRQIGSYQPAPQMRMMSMDTQGARAVPAAFRTEIPGMEKGYVAGISADEKYTSITIYKDGEVYETLTLSAEDWFNTTDTYMDKGFGMYSVPYIIAEAGNYSFEAEGALICEVIEILPIPEFTDISVDTESKTISWSINAAGEDKIDDLFVQLTLHSMDTGEMVQVLSMTDETEDVYTEKGDKVTIPVTKLKARDGSFKYTLNENLSTGSYFVRASLLEKDSDGDINLDLMDADSFEHVNKMAPSKTQTVSTEYIGGGAIKISWAAVEGADGYMVAVLDENNVPVESLTSVNVAKDEDGNLKTETIIQGGTASLMINGETGEAGLEFGKDYNVSVKAYKNNTVSLGELRTSSYDIPVYGEANIVGFSISEPVIPEFTITVEGGTASEGETRAAFAVNKLNPKINVEADKDVGEIKVWKVNGEDNNVATITGKSGSFTYDFKEDGIYYLRFDTSFGEEQASQLITIEVDTKAPYLDVDGGSTTAINGAININGMVEKGATLTFNGENVEVTDGEFTIEGTMDLPLMQMHLIARDSAGNVTERIMDIIYVAEGEDDDDGGGKSGTNIKVAPAGNIITIGGLQIETPVGKEPVTAEDGTITLPGGGSILLQGGTVLTVPEDTVILADGSIKLPESGSGTSTFTSGLTMTLRGGTVLIPDKTISIGYRLEPQENFEDVNKGSWYEDPIAFVYGHSLFAGTGNNIFSPELTMTRGMLATVLWRMAGTPNPQGKNQFVDLNEAWYKDAVLWANENNIVSGYGGQFFGSDDNITREQVAVILYRYSQYKNYDVELRADLSIYDDKEHISSWAAEAMSWANANGLITGRTDKELAPKGNATRAEIAAILYRFITGTLSN
ncbi:S-layer homology domain-containing protein [Sedimentibacter hydroxybenzoicus DSM 7310]|uniref:S-layer homology domain-containing protein n=1 Tax=Sedimentibacter hydroxybenzoicus DSM 7310 TaxID=1123245 RepID=A0A974GW31_SEDHY|nr:S-layer homology domain-containing protein [Sedimentibacter hydroxybenzoicus]NYB73645.1 S-layer homology domain-containing protein [Sedimentibacter hydroxybenzoicus DSM 7310]